MNPTFTDAGAAPGQAAHWTLRTFCAAERIAAFGPAPHEAWEGFERWFDLRLAFAQGDLAMALFDPIPEGHEDFEEAWANDNYLSELPAGQIAVATFGDGTIEDLEHGWSNVPFATSWAEVTATVGVFAGSPVENLESGWRSNEAYQFSWDDLSMATCLFDAGSEPREPFEGLWPHTTTL